MTPELCSLWLCTAYFSLLPFHNSDHPSPRFSPPFAHLYKNVEVPVEAPQCELLRTVPGVCWLSSLLGVSADSQRGPEGLLSQVLTPPGRSNGEDGVGWIGWGFHAR